MKYCLYYNHHKHRCMASVNPQPDDQFKNMRNGKETDLCLSCRKHHNEQNRRVRAGLTKNKGGGIRINNRKLKPGNEPKFYIQEETDKHFEIWRKWLRDLCLGELK